MMDWNLYLNFTVAMLAIVNPLGLIPLWSELTSDMDRPSRRKLADWIIITSLIILLIFLMFGEQILSLFSIDLSVFQIAGGILLLSTGLSMVNGKVFRIENHRQHTEDPYQLVKTRFRDILVPLAIPMLSGPGSLTTVVLYGHRIEGTLDYFVISGVLTAIMVLLLLVFYFSEKIERSTDPIIFNILTRLFGILVVAVSIQFMVEGLGGVFPNWLENIEQEDLPDSISSTAMRQFFMSCFQF